MGDNLYWLWMSLKLGPANDNFVNLMSKVDSPYDLYRMDADGVVFHDPSLNDATRLAMGTEATLECNKPGSLTFTLPPGNVMYKTLRKRKSVVTLYHGSEIIFRGRVLDTVIDLQSLCEVYCEGELALLHDSLQPPIEYKGSAAGYFMQMVANHNATMDADKQFAVGEVSAVNGDHEVDVETDEYRETLEEMRSLLVDEFGGYLRVRYSGGVRYLDYIKDYTGSSGQKIQFGVNLVDIQKRNDTVNLCTVLVPMGKEGLTIESVNGGLDYLEDAEARALRGYVSRPVFWDDVTEPANLLRKAREWLAEHRNVITTLTLTAVDLALLNRTGQSGTVDSFRVGDTIRVRSKPHAVDEDFRLTEYTEDWLTPDASTITLGKSKSSLTSADVAGDNHSLNEIQKTTHQIKSDYTVNLANAVAETERKLRSLIEQTSEAIRLEVSQEYTTNDKLTAAVSSSMEQLADSFTFQFTELQAVVDENGAIVENRFTELYSYIRMAGGVLTFGSNENGITLSLENDLIVFRKNGAEFGWWDGVDFHTGNIVVEVNERAQFGNFAAIPRSNGSLSWLKVRG